MIGRFLELSVQAEDVLASLGFYESLGFRQLAVGETWPHPYAVVCDGRAFIGLHAYEFESPALTFVLPELAAKLAPIERLGVTLAFRKTEADEFNEAGFIAPGGQMVALLEARTYSPPSFDDADFSVCGRFAEYSLPVNDLEGSLAWWQGLGLRPVIRREEPHARASLCGDGLVIGLHERPALRHRALTYLCPDLDTACARLADAGLEPDCSVPNLLEGARAAALRSPEGLWLRLCEPARQVEP